MAVVRINQGQCLMDIAIQKCGDATAIFEIAELNGIEITGLINAGDQIQVPETYNAAISEYLAQKNIVPATNAACEAVDVKPLDGIGYMRIGSTFKVR